MYSFHFARRFRRGTQNNIGIHRDTYCSNFPFIRCLLLVQQNEANSLLKGNGHAERWSTLTHHDYGRQRFRFFDLTRHRKALTRFVIDP